MLFTILGIGLLVFWVYRQITIFAKNLSLVSIAATVKSCEHKCERDSDGNINIDEYAASVQGELNGENVEGNITVYRGYHAGEQILCVCNLKTKKIIKKPDMIIETPEKRCFAFLAAGLISLATAFVQAKFEFGVAFLMAISLLAYGIIYGCRELFYIFAGHEEIEGVIVNKGVDFGDGTNKVLPLYQYAFNGEVRLLKGQYPREVRKYTIGDKVILRYNSKIKQVYETRQNFWSLMLCGAFCAVGVFMVFMLVV